MAEVRPFGEPHSGLSEIELDTGASNSPSASIKASSSSYSSTSASTVALKTLICAYERRGGELVVASALLKLLLSSASSSLLLSLLPTEAIILSLFNYQSEAHNLIKILQILTNKYIF